jgi:hypothetical protein
MKTFQNTNPLDAIVPNSSLSRQHTDKLCKKLMAKTFEVGWIAGGTDRGN